MSTPLRLAALRLLVLLAFAGAWLPARAVEPASAPSPPTNCRHPFAALAERVIRQCSGQQQTAAGAIDAAKQSLLRLGLASPADFEGVEIRWCAIATPGMTPEPGRIFLNRELAVQPTALAGALAGQLHHVRQFRVLGTEGYSCQSSKDLVAGRRAATSVLARDAQVADARAVAALQQVNCRPSTGTWTCSAGATPPLPGLCRCGAWRGPVPP